MVKEKVKWVWKSKMWIAIVLAYTIVPFSIIVILNKLGVIPEGSDNVILTFVFIAVCIGLVKTNRDERNIFSKIFWVLLMCLGLLIIAAAIFVLLGSTNFNPEYHLFVSTWLASIPLVIGALRLSTIFVKKVED
ncbi:hypothetical protein KAU32_02815 [bacterium]|nr:hypothetical protein [bacterium]